MKFLIVGLLLSSAAYGSERDVQGNVSRPSRKGVYSDQAGRSESLMRVASCDSKVVFGRLSKVHPRCYPKAVHRQSGQV